MHAIGVLVDGEGQSISSQLLQPQIDFFSEYRAFGAMSL
jgi:hypothetical protein